MAEFTPVTFDEFKSVMSEAGHSEDAIRSMWTALDQQEIGIAIGVQRKGGAAPTTPIPTPMTGIMPDPRGMGVARYKQYLQSQEDARLDAFANSQMQTPTEFFPDAPKPVESTAAPKPGALRHGAEVTGAQLIKGGTQFVRGLYNAAKPRILTGDQEIGGEALLGAMTLMMALPSGIGTAFVDAMSNYVPNMDMTVAISGQKGRTGEASPAGMIRAFLGAPTLLLDKDIRKMIQEHPERIDEELNRSMTYRELIENIIAFGTAPAATRAAGAFARRGMARFGTPEPLQIQQAVKGAVPDVPAPPAQMNSRVVSEPAMGGGATYTSPIDIPVEGTVYNRAASFPDYVSQATQPRNLKITNLTPEDLAARLDDVAKQTGAIKEAVTPEGEGALKPSAAETPNAPAGPTMLESITGQGEGGGRPMPGAAASPEEAARMGAQITGAETAPTPVQAQAASVKAAMDTIQKEITAPAEVLPEPPSGAPRPAKGDYLKSIAADVEAAMKAYLGDQAGKVDPMTLVSMAAGAIIGGTQGTTPEERLTYALAGLVGGPFARRLAGKIVDAVRKNPEAAPILDETNPVNRNFDPPVPEFAATDRALGNLEMQQNLARRILTNDPPLTRVDLRGAQEVSARAAKNVVDIAKRIVDGAPVEPGELKQALALARDLYTSVRKIGREVGVSNLPPREAALAAKNHINRLAKEWDSAHSEGLLAQMVLDLPDVGLGSRLYYAVPDALLETMYTGQLLGKSIVKNGMAMMLTMPLTALSRGMASLRVWDPARPVLQSGPMAFVAAIEGLSEQIRLAKSWDKLGMQAAALGSTKVEVFPRGYAALGEIASDYNLDGLAKGLNFMHTMAGVAPETLARTDGMGKAVFGRIGILWEAQEQAAREGLKGQAFAERVTDLRTNYDQLDPQALIRVGEFRDRITANKRFEGAFMQMLQAGPQDPWANLAYRVLIAPYVRTPIRLAELHADFTPGLNRLSTNYRLAMERGGIEASMAKGQLYAGVAVVTGFAALAMQGYVTGACPSDGRERKRMSDAGRPCMSFWDPLSEKFRSYEGLEPLSTLVSVGATLAEHATKMPEQSWTNLLIAAGLSEVESIPQKSYIQAVSELHDVIKNGTESDAMWEKSLDYINRRLASFNPTGVRELARLADPTQMRTLKSGAYDNDHTASASIRREWWALYDKYSGGNKIDRNMWTGEPLLNTTWPFNPFTAKAYRGDKWAQEITRLDGAGIEPITEWVGGRAPGVNIGLEPVTPSPAVRLTPKQFDRLEVLMTQVARDAHGKLTDSLDHLVQSPLYNRMPDVTRKEMLQSRWSQFYQRGLGKLLQEDRGLRLQMEDAVRTNDIKRGPTDSNRMINIRINPAR